MMDRVFVCLRLEAVKSTNEHLMDRKAYSFYELQLSKRAMLALAANVVDGRELEELESQAAAFRARSERRILGGCLIALAKWKQKVGQDRVAI